MSNRHAALKQRFVTYYSNLPVTSGVSDEELRVLVLYDLERNNVEQGYEWATASEIDDRGSQLKYMRNWRIAWQQRLDQEVYQTLLFDCLNSASELENVDDLYTLTESIGELHQRKGEFEKAICFFDDQLKHAESIGKNGYISSALHNLAGAYGRNGRFERALEHAKKDVDFNIRTGSARNVILAWSRMSLILEHDGHDFFASMNLRRNTYEVAHEFGFEQGRLANAYTLGTQAEQSGFPLVAQFWYERAFAAAKAGEHTTGIRITRKSLIQTRNQLKLSSTETEKLAEENLQFESEFGSSQSQAEAHALLIETVLRGGHPKRAWELLEGVVRDPSTGHEVLKELSTLVTEFGSKCESPADQIQFGEKALSLHKELFGDQGQWPSIVFIHLHIGVAQAKRADFSTCMESVKAAIGAAERSQSQRVIDQALEKSLRVHSYFDGVEDQIKLAEGVLEILENRGDTNRASIASAGLGNLQILNGNLSEGIARLKAALMEDTGDRYEEKLGICYQAGMALSGRQKWEARLQIAEVFRESSEYGNEVLVLCSLLADTVGEAGAIEHLGLVSEKLLEIPDEDELRELTVSLLGAVDNLPSAMADACLDELEPKLGEHGDIVVRGLLHLARAKRQLSSNCPTEALESLSDAKPLISEFPAGQIDLLLTLGVARQACGDVATAQEMLEKALSVSSDSGNKYATSIVMCQLASLHFNCGRVGQAEKYLSDVSHVIDLSINDRIHAYWLTLRASFLMTQATKDWVVALDEDSTKVADPFASDRIVSDVEREQAYSLATEAWSIANRLQDEEILRIATECRARCAAKTRRLHEAEEYASRLEAFSAKGASERLSPAAIQIQIDILRHQKGVTEKAAFVLDSIPKQSLIKKAEALALYGRACTSEGMLDEAIAALTESVDLLAGSQLEFLAGEHAAQLGHLLQEKFRSSTPSVFAAVDDELQANIKSTFALAESRRVCLEGIDENVRRVRSIVKEQTSKQGESVSIRRVFEEMQKHFSPESAKGIDATYCFKISGQMGGTWVFSIKENHSDLFELPEGEEPKATPSVTIELADYVWLDIRSGRTNSQSAFMEGKLKIRGDMNVAMRLQTLFPIDVPARPSLKSALEKFELPPELALPLRRAQVSARIALKLTGETNDNWTIAIENGKLSIDEGLCLRPTLEISLPHEIGEALLQGRLELESFLESNDVNIRGDVMMLAKLVKVTMDARPSGNEAAKEPHNTWQVLSKEAFSVSAPPVQTRELPAGAYTFRTDRNDNIVCFRAALRSDDLISVPGSIGYKIVEEIERFWSKGDRFAEIGVLHKRGYLLHGRPGCGKSSIINQVVEGLTQSNGITFICDTRPDRFLAGLAAFRKVEPNRPITCIYEDIDDIIEEYNDRILLQMLDGNSQTDKIVNIATTNNIDKLPSRIVKRPRRFDRVIEVVEPDEEHRSAFLAMKWPRQSKEERKVWVQKTEGLSYAALCEVIVGAYCLENDLDETIDNIKKQFAG